MSGARNPSRGSACTLDGGEFCSMFRICSRTSAAISGPRKSSTRISMLWVIRSREMRSLTSACADFLLPLFGLFHVLANPSLDDPADQRIGNALFQRKSQVALFIRIGRHIGAKFCIRSHRWIEADVMLEGGEMYEVAAKGERGYLVADGFRGIGRSFPDRRPDLFQY